MITHPHNYKLTIAYDGTAYCGWQVQPNGITVQEILQKKISIITRIPVSLIGSGRTDAGVHALGQIANFHSPLIPDLYRFHGSLNSLLPPDIRILNAEEATNTFHAQYSATGKIYHYHLHLNRVMNPFKRCYSYHIKQKIDLNQLKEAAQLFVGTHDFTSFANERHLGSAARNPIRTLFRLDIKEEEGGIRLEFEGDGFLYKMVRNITGTLIETASGKYSKDDIRLMFQVKDRKAAGQAAPPQGLFLVKVHYPSF